MLDRILYPALTAYDAGYLQTPDGHEIYYERSGNRQGKPALFLHGGPGGGTSPLQRRFFDPEIYNIILFDQRGCGKSRPHASLENNTTRHLIDDIEALRGHLNIDRWQIFGGSWGSTLGILYAQAHPGRVTELILRGIFLMRRQDIDWYYRCGASRFFPEAWQAFIAPIPEEERADMIAAYYRRLTADDPEIVAAAARPWAMWEADTLALRPDKGAAEQMKAPAFANAFARIECHYFINKGFLERDNRLLEDAHKIRDIPAAILHGRYDVICPSDSAYLLHKALPQSRLEIIEASGHSAFEPEIARALVAVTDRFKNL